VIHPNTDEVSRKKTPLLQLTDRDKERFQKFKAPVPASTPFPSPLNTPVLLVASRGQVSKVLHQFVGKNSTPGSIGFAEYLQ
jgi:hypothetical protein